MRRRIRRRQQVVWLKNEVNNVSFGAGRSTGSVADDAPVVEILKIPADSFTLPDVTTIPLFLDSNPEEAQAGAPATVLEHQGFNFNQEWGYKLLRIVGKLCLVAGPNDAQVAAFPGLHVKMGIMVRRVDPETGVALAQGPLADPLAFSNLTDPWIWQRSYYMSTTQVTNPSGPLEVAIQNSLPQSTFDVGGSKDGPVFDIKTKRIIGPEERLFWHMSAVGIPQGDAASLVGASATFLYLRIDYRGLATVFSRRGNRRNASR